MEDEQFSVKHYDARVKDGWYSCAVNILTGGAMPPLFACPVITFGILQDIF